MAAYRRVFEAGSCLQALGRLVCFLDSAYHLFNVREHDAVKAIMAGAEAVQVVSTLLRHGPTYLAQIRKEMIQCMEENRYSSLTPMRSSMGVPITSDSQASERANYLRTLQGWSKSGWPANA